MLLFKLTYLQLPMLVMVIVGVFYPSASSEWTFIVPSFLFFLVSSISPSSHSVLVFMDSPPTSELSPPKPEQGMSIPVIGSSKLTCSCFFLLGKHNCWCFCKLHLFWFHSSSTFSFQSPSLLQLPSLQHLPLATPFLQWWAAVWYHALPLHPLAQLTCPTVSMEHQRDLTLHLWRIHLRGTKTQRSHKVLYLHLLYHSHTL